MSKDQNYLDALGQPIIIGDTYGYSDTSSGFTYVVIGKAKKITEKGFVTIQAILKKTQLYMNEVEIDHKYGASCSVKPLKLFKIKDGEL